MTTKGGKEVGLGGLRGQMIALQGPWGPQRGGLEGARGSKGGPTGSQVVMDWAYRVSKGQGVGLEGPRGS